MNHIILHAEIQVNTRLETNFVISHKFKLPHSSNRRIVKDFIYISDKMIYNKMVSIHL